MKTWLVLIGSTCPNSSFHSMKKLPGWVKPISLDHPAYTVKGKAVWGETSRALNIRMAEQLNGECILAFSAGKDSIAAWIELRNYFDRIIPVYRYPVPDLSFVEDSLRYYEDAFGTEIVRVPHESLIGQLSAAVWQTKGSWEAIKAKKIPRDQFSNEEMLAYVGEDYNLPEDFYTAVGVRASDSVMRLTSVMRFGPVNKKRRSWWPVFDWSKAQLVDTIAASKVRLPVDYHLFGRSFDGLNDEYVRAIRERYPQDFEKILDWFPLIENDLKRHEWRERHFAKEA